MRAQIVALHQRGDSYRTISSALNVPLATISRTINLYRQTNSFSFKKRTGRKRSTSSRTDNAIARAATINPFASSSSIRAAIVAGGDIQISARTIRRRLVEKNLKSYRPAKKPMLSKKNVRDRIAFCKKYAHWTIDQWRNVVCADETTLTQHATFKACVRRPPGTRFSPKYTLPTVKNAPKIMVWGAIAARGRCGLWFMPPGTTVNGGVYLNILKEKLTTFMTMRGCSHFLHDGAPCHRTRAVLEWLREERVELVGPWPGNSPDLNPLENCWRVVKEKVANHNPTSSKHLEEVIKQVWCLEITPEYTDRLMCSMPDRIKQCLKVHGLHTKY